MCQDLLPKLHLLTYFIWFVVEKRWTTLKTFRIPNCSLRQTMKRLLARTNHYRLCPSLIYNTHYRDTWTQVHILLFLIVVLECASEKGKKCHSINHSNSTFLKFRLLKKIMPWDKGNSKFQVSLLECCMIFNNFISFFFFFKVKPHVTDEEYRQTEFIVQQFASGIGKELHKKLVEKASKERNWVRQTNKLRYPIHIGTLFSNLIK